jgi:hypothetical protein
MEGSHELNLILKRTRTENSKTKAIVGEVKSMDIVYRRSTLKIFDLLTQV